MLSVHLGEIEGKPFKFTKKMNDCGYGIDIILETITDVVEVVRCKDCKFATEYFHGDFECRCPHTPWASDEYAIPCKANDFCSYGERREG